MSPSRLLPPLLAAAAAMLAGGLAALGPVAGPDELTYLSHGLRQRAGEVLYRDFFEFVAPGLSWLAVLFAPSLLGARLCQAAFLAVGAVLAQRLGRALGLGPWAAALPGLALSLALFRFYPYWSYHWLVVPVLLAAALCCLRGLESEGTRPWLAAGALAGVAALLLQSDGALACGLVAGSAIADGLLGRKGAGVTARRLGAAAAGASAPLGLAALVLLVQGALPAAFEHVVTWTLTHYRQPGGINDVKLGTDAARFLAVGPEWRGVPHFYARAYHGAFLLLVVPASAALAAAWLLGQLRRREPWPVEDARLAVLALLALGSAALAAAGRADAAHVAMYALPALIVATLAAERLAAALAAPTLVFVAALPRLAIAAFIATGAAWWVDDVRGWPSLAGPDAAHRASPLIRELAVRARPGDRAIAFPAGGPVYVYGLPPASRYTLMLPGIGYTGPEEFAAMRDEVRRNRPRFLVFVPFADEAITRPDWFLRLTPGYTRVSEVDAPLPGMRAKAWLYERDEGI